jgi:m7GpppX diphosphatase
MACPLHVNDYILLGETPAMYARASMCHFIQQEVVRPNKQWIAHIIEGRQETEEIICRTKDFVLLPDTERINRYWRTIPNQSSRYCTQRVQKRVLNWLAIAQDRSLRTIRDLRGTHIQMLKDLLETCMQCIEAETGIRRHQVMAYVHYPPSVYQLHVHFSYPYGQYCHRDAYRVHNLAAIINNLEIDPDFYIKATLQLAIPRHSPNFAALTGPEPSPENAPPKTHEACT